MPGPTAVQIGQGCFLLAHGSIMPGDVDWVQFSIPRATTQTLVDVDFPSGSGASAMIASVVNGSTGFNAADNNGSRDGFCGLGAASSPLGNTRDSVIDLRATSRHAIINIGITGAADTSFIGLHNEFFTYDLWVYVLPINCTNDAGCNDNVACTLDHCDVVSGVCDNTPDDASCDNGVFCDGVEYCDTRFDCQSDAPPDCDDGVECTIDFCDFNSDQCASEPDDFFCDDGLFCNGWEVCDPSLGCVAGPPADCDDGIRCTRDACDENTWRCTHAPDESACDDGLFCNGIEHCDANGDCTPGTPPICDDGVACTVDSCDEATRACVHKADDSTCDDGRFCNGAETCDLVAGCRAGAPPHCDDGVSCTVDACDEVAAACVSTPDDSVCDDGRFCNGAETCDLVAGCRAGTPPSCDDGVNCTVDSCDSVSDTCLHAPDDGLCQNGLFCDGAEVCDAGTGCVSGADPCPGSLCREGDDRCVECFSNADCDDRVFCNGAEFCDAAGNCAAGAAPCAAGETCNEADARCESNSDFALDIKPGMCPNRLQTNARGQVQMAVMGNAVASIDVRTVALSRTDGAGGSVRPLQGPSGPRPQLSDVASPSPGGPCSCGSSTSDGMIDLVLPFDQAEMLQTLRLDSLRSGAEVQLRVSGRLRDGTPFEVVDCVTVQTPGRPSTAAVH